MLHRVGIIGVGLMGQRMLSAFQRHDRFRVTLIHDADSELAARVAGDHEAIEVAPNGDALIAAPEIDAVYVASPPRSHLDYVRRTVEAGKPIFCEKPLATDVAAATQLVEDVESAGVPNAINFPFATLPGLATVERELDSGRAGALRRLDLTLHFSAWPRTWHKAGPWLSGTADGGFLREVFSHFVYLTHRLVGPLERLESTVRYPATGGSEEYVAARFECAGIPVSLVAAAGGAAPDYNDWRLYGSERCYRLEDWSRLSVSTLDGWEPIDGTPQPGHGQLDALAALLEGADSVLPDLRCGLEVQRVVEGILRD